MVQLREAIIGAANGADRPEANEAVVLYIADTGAGFVFAAEEIGELHRLLDGAQLMLDLGRDSGPPAG